MSKLNERAMLVSLSISQWTAKKLDKRVTHETNQAHGASEDAGRYNKSLLAKSALANIQAAAGNARTTHYNLTLPWWDDGTRILPAAMFEEYRRKINDCKAAFNQAVEAFHNNYEHFQAQARRDLNGMFSESDYPAKDDIMEKFSFAMNVWPLPDSADFRAAITEDQADAIRQEIEASARTAQENAAADLWRRLYDVVSRAAEKLAEPERTTKDGKSAPPIFRDSLIENIRELTDLLPALNITQNPDLDRLAQEAREKLTAASPDTLRASANTRAETAQAAADILDKIKQYSR